jgi:hypothetical protein
MIRLSVLVLLAFALYLGCAKREEPPVDVSGTVTLDDKPLPEGEVYFISLGKAPQILPIKDGAFAGKAMAGERRVEIRAYRQGTLPPTATVGAEPPRENYIPAKYNIESELKEEVKKPGPNTFEFKLKSKD